MAASTTINSQRSGRHYPGAAILAALLVCLLWSYWPTIADLRAFWAVNEDYSVGQLVPFVAVYLAWRCCRRVEFGALRPCWWGLAVIGVAQAGRFFGVYFFYVSIERYCLVLAIAGVVLLVLGAAMFRRLLWVLVFLLLMVPLPRQVHEAVSLPLQTVASASAAFVLEMLGFVIVREGNALRLDDQAVVAVTEACNGLRMLTAFVFVAAVLAFLIRRPPWQRATILASSIPIAIVTNAIRLVVTSVCVAVTGDASIDEMVHNYAGLAMMPVAVLALAGELWLLPRLTHMSVSRGAELAGSRAG